MRIVGGRLRGKALASPADDRVRPTSDRVRESVFNILAHNDFGVGFELQDARVMDLFAGTGALGCEALSRGAKFALLNDDDADSRGLIRQNVEALSLTGVTKIWKRDGQSLGAMPPNAGGPFDLVFLDPPYAKGLVNRALTTLRDGAWLSPASVVMAETGASEPLPGVEGFTIEDQRQYGDTRVMFLVRSV